MKVENTLDVYEVDGLDVNRHPELKPKERPELGVHSHWSDPALVVIVLEGRSVTVKATELSKAVANATNWRTYG